MFITLDYMWLWYVRFPKKSNKSTQTLKEDFEIEAALSGSSSMINPPMESVDD